MRSLFPVHVEVADIPDIPGLAYLRDYISTTEEMALQAAIDREFWDTTWDRRRQPYGGSYGSAEKSENDKTERPIPDWGLSLAERMHREGVTERPFDHMLVNEYLPGQGIALHRDYSPFDCTVVSLSLLSPCVMDFRRLSDGRRESLLLEPRSLLILSDAARYEWQHGIARRKSDRWQGIQIRRERRLSATFRRRKEREHVKPK